VKKLRIGFGKPGDVILAHNATVGRVGIAGGSTEFIVSTSTTYYRVNPDKLDKYFLAYFMQSGVYQRQLADVMGQTTRNQVPITAQKELFMAFPDKDEQSRIATVMAKPDAAAEKENEDLQKRQALKRGLMEDLLTGTVRVSHLLKE
jgi:type I restriction enzyme S subunit